MITKTTAKKEKDPFEEAVEILQGYQEGLPESKNEGCCEGCQVATDEINEKKNKVNRPYYEAEY